jgi:hypothetical protein
MRFATTMEVQSDQCCADALGLPASSGESFQQCCGAAADRLDSRREVWEPYCVSIRLDGSWTAAQSCAERHQYCAFGRSSAR